MWSVLCLALIGCGNVVDSSSINTPAATSIISTPSNPTPTLLITTNETIATNTTENLPDFTFTPVIAPTPTPPHTIRHTAIPNNNTPTHTNTSAKPTLAVTTSVPTFIAGNTPDSEEQKFLQLLNDYRRSNGVEPLVFDQHLFSSASWLAEDMAAKNYISHTDSLKRTIPQRIQAFGYPSPRVGENIAGGFELAQDNLNIWQSDQIHKDNLLGKYYKKAGVGRYYMANSLNHWYWVLDLGG
jgi:uncharacterized protein YkwD